MTTTIDCRAILFDMDGTLVDSTVVANSSGPDSPSASGSISPRS
jgi:hypothetical protein